MKAHGLIYLLTFIKPHEKDYYYVGQTTQPLKTRINDGHINRAWKLDSNGNFENNYRVAREIRKYGIRDKEKEIIWSYDNDIKDLDTAGCYLKVDILCSVNSQEELDEKEKFYILKYRSYEHFKDSRGFNGTLGGYGNSGGVPRGELSPSAQLTNYQAKQVRLLNRDTSLTYKDIADLMKCSLGCIHGIVYGVTYREVVINHKDELDEEFKIWKNYAPKSLKSDNDFYCYDLRKNDPEERVQLWKCATECAAALPKNVRAQYIYYALAGKKGIVGDHFAFTKVNNRYAFEQTHLPLLVAKHKKRFRAFSAYNIKNREKIKNFTSMGDCLKQLNLVHNAPIYKCLYHKTSYSGNYIFIYDDEFHPELLKCKMEQANQRPFYSFDIDGKQIGSRWIVINECARFFRIHESNISRCLMKNTIYKEKYIFIYEDEFSHELLNSIKKNRDQKESYHLLNLEGESLGIAKSQYELYHHHKIFTTSYALKSKKYYIPSRDLIIIPDSEYNIKKINAILEIAREQSKKFKECKEHIEEEIRIYSKDSFIISFPNTRAAINSGIVPSHAVYTVPKRKNKIYKNKYIIIYGNNATPSTLAQIRKQFK